MRATKRTPRDEKLARIYDDEILPIWAERFGRMVLRDLDVPTKATALDVGCATGYLTLALAERLGGESRIIALEPSPGLLSVARKKAGPLSGKRVFFRGADVSTRLPFADDVYDLVVCNLGLAERTDPLAALADFARVTKPGGLVVCTLPLAGTWGEFHDIFREVLIKKDRHDALGRLDEYLASSPQPGQAVEWLAAAGLTAGSVEVEEFTLLFRSSREFFFAPLVDFGPLAAWKRIAGSGAEVQEIFWETKRAIDAYFAGSAFRVTVRAGRIAGQAPLVAGVEAEGSPTSEESLPTTEERLIDQGTGEQAIFLETGDIELIESSVRTPKPTES